LGFCAGIPGGYKLPPHRLLLYCACFSFQRAGKLSKQPGNSAARMAVGG